MFIDNLAFTQVLLVFAAAILTYAGVTVWWAMRRNDPARVRSAIRGTAVPIGSIGLVSVILGLWSEMVWPFPSSMAGYNILFDDVVLIFGIVMITFAVSAYLGLRMQYVGLLAFVAGAVTLLYGWTGYGFNYTKEPFDFLLLYAGFGVAGLTTLPATLAVDFYLATAGTGSPWSAPSSSPSSEIGMRFGTRAVQPIGVSAGAPPVEGSAGEGIPVRFRLPAYMNLIMLTFPVFMALAGIAAWWFLGTTLPGHLTPGKTP